MRSTDLRSGRDGLEEGVRSSCLEADGLVSSPIDVESSPACHCANSRNFCRLSSSSVASGPMLVSQALISAGGNLSRNIGIRASLTGRRPANGSRSRAVRQRRCFVTSSTNA
ncbi:hypothetical protein T03_17100 [Trichinella britovi]|uniref:Uncharacterized protein n=1 Tax=Trichinella britovi TaxID=45882 RepID=A0A0V1C4F1_TRIBR|nr:hypothetical protein T03_17100 [Trichinella britovi]